MSKKEKPKNFNLTFSQSEAARIIGNFSCEFLETLEIVESVRQGKKLLLSNSPIGTSKKIFIKIKSRNYLLKELPWYIPDNNFGKDVTKLQTILCEEYYIPIPKYLKCKKTDEFVYIDNSDCNSIKTYTLQEMLDCQSWDCSVNNIRSSALVSKNMHDACLRVNNHKLLHDIPHDNIFDHSLKFLDIGYNEIKDKILETDKLIRLINNYRNIIVCMKDEAKKKKYFNLNIPVHGDYHQNNILFDISGNAIGIIDFDDCCIDNPVNDLARILLSFGFFDVSKIDKPFSTIPTKINSEIIGEYIECYTNGNKNSDFIIPCLILSMKVLTLQLLFLGILKGEYTVDMFSDLMQMTRLIDSEFIKIESYIKKYL